MTTSIGPGRSTAVRTGTTRPRAIAVVAATLAPLAVWLVATQLFGTDLLVRPVGGNPQHVGAATVVAVALSGSLLGWALLALLERRTARARTLWTGVALAVLLLSLTGPLTAGAAAATKAVLVLMHLAVAAVLVPALRHSSPIS